MYEEAKKVLKKTLPDDIVIYILKKCFYGEGAKYTILKLFNNFNIISFITFLIS